MFDALRLYARYAGISIRAQMQYRLSFAMQTLGHLMVTGIEFLAIFILFERFGSLEEWALAEVALLYGMVHVAFAVAESVARGFDTFPGMVKRGDFDRILLRPRGTAFQVVAQELQLMRVGRLGQGLAVLCWAAVALEIEWTPAKALLLAASIFGGACVFAGLFVFQATLAFWTTETLELMNILSYGGVEAAQFPISIYRAWFRRFFTFVVPLACINYFPAHAILGRPDPLGSPVLFQWLAPAAGVLFLTASLQVWKLGVRRYTSTGS